MKRNSRSYPRIIGCGIIKAMLVGAWLASAGAQASLPTAPNFDLTDLTGRNQELYRAEGKAVVLFFTGNGCPIARQSINKLKALRDEFGKQADFWIINTYAEDSLEDTIKEYRDFKMWPLMYLRDPKQGVALTLGVERTAEVVAIRTSDRSIFYQGSIDDQLSEGAQRKEPQVAYLKKALTEMLADQPITTATTTAHGCRITFASVGDAQGHISYARQVVPILQQHCVECHREGSIGPWAMKRYGLVKNYASMIQETLLTGRMPPWHADPAHGHWANDRSLRTEESQTLLRWIAAGAPRGEEPDPLTQPLAPLPDWPLGKPDLIVKLPKPEQIPANGVLDYRHITVDLPMTNEFWVAGVDIKPGNRSVVHHVIVRAKWDGGPDDDSGFGVHIAGWAPGLKNVKFPSGTSMRIGAGAKIDLEIHYTTIGTPQTDQTEVAFYLLANKPEREFAIRSARQLFLNIPPGTDESRDTAIYGFRRPSMLYWLMPHMHLRGKWMQFELLLPNGRRETLLNVPRYDFNWQTVYYFAEPRQVPAGAWLVVTGGFDNSAANPANPNPKERIHFGLQSWDEMFIGFLGLTEEPGRIVTAANTVNSEE